MFKHLRTKLTVLYVALFLSALGLIALAVYVATTHNVQRMVSDQLQVSGTVFENLENTRYRRLEDEAQILAHDFGFRAAVATGDRATVRSALDNLASRSGIDLAFVVGIDGQVTAQDPSLDSALPQDVMTTVMSDESVSGIFSVNGVAYEAVVAPVRAPEPAGWVVFATALGPAAMNNLTKLSAIPLQATVMQKAANGVWAPIGGHGPADARLEQLVVRSAAAKTAAPFKLTGQGGATIALVRRQPGLGDSQQFVLVLRCPLAAALRPYTPLFLTIAVIGSLGLALLVIGSWFLARTLTRPITALEDIAKRLQRGEVARVTVDTNDEIARLGLTFNAMADEIQAREANLKQARDVAEAANQAKSTFLANMNHEFRTPLNGVLGIAGVLGKTKLSDGQQQMVGIIEESGAALQRILNDVLDMVELGTGKLEIINQPFDAGALVQALTTAAAADARAKGLTFRLDWDGGANDWVVGDRLRVEQVLSNLLTNAVKFTDKGDVGLRVRLAAEAPIYQFEVWDTGVGFDAAHAEALFQPFSQADGSMTRRAGGTGLGLSLARDLARAMGGDITCDSRVGQGSTFVFSVRLEPSQAVVPAQGAPASEAEPGEEASGTDSPAVRVLLAEDNPTNRRVIELILGALDVDLVSVENGAEAVEAFSRESFDVVLMDIQMPVMDGLTAIRLIRQHEGETHRPRTPILVVSANVQAEHMHASTEAGADGHLAKPIMAPVLIGALEAALSGPTDGAVAEAASHQDDPPAPSSAVRVLLAEDNPTNRRVIELILGALDVDLVSVENGAEAVEAFSRESFDVVLMDIQMPVMDGLTAIRLIRQHEGETHRPRTPILVVSANVQAEHMHASAAAGADGHLAKPIMAPVLIEALEAALSGPSEGDNLDVAMTG